MMFKRLALESDTPTDDQLEEQGIPVPEMGQGVTPSGDDAPSPDVYESSRKGGPGKDSVFYKAEELHKPCLDNAPRYDQRQMVTQPDPDLDEPDPAPDTDTTMSDPDMTESVLAEEVGI